MLINGNSGAVTGSFTLGTDFTIASGKTLTIPAGAYLTVPNGKTLTNSGAILVRDGGSLSVAASNGVQNSGTIVYWTGMMTNPSYVSGTAPVEGTAAAIDMSAALPASGFSIPNDFGADWTYSNGKYTVTGEVTITGDNGESNRCLQLNNGAKLIVDGYVKIKTGSFVRGIYLPQSSAATIGGNGVIELNGGGYGFEPDQNSQLTIDGNVVFSTSGISYDKLGGNTNLFTMTVAKGLFINGNSGTVGGSVSLGANFTIASGKTLTIPNGAYLTIPSGKTLTNSGTITIPSGGTLTVQSGGTLTNSGTIVVQNSGTLTLSSGGTLTNSGVIFQLSGGTFSGNANVSGSGAIFDGTTVNMPNADETAYSQYIMGAATSGITWSKPSGDLPPGLSLTAATGLVSGTATAGGTYTSTMRATLTANTSIYMDMSVVIQVVATGANRDVIDMSAANPPSYGAGWTYSGGTDGVYTITAGSTVTITGDGTGSNRCVVLSNNSTLNLSGSVKIATMGSDGFKAIDVPANASATIGGTGTLEVTSRNPNNGISIGASGTLMLNGNVAVIASGNSGDAPTVTKGLLISGTNSAVVMNGAVTLSSDVTIASGKTLTIPNGAVLTVPDGKVLTNSGTISISGGGKLTVETIGGLPNSGAVYYRNDADITNLSSNNGNITINPPVKTGASSANLIDMSDTNPPSSGTDWTYSSNDGGIYTIQTGANVTITGNSTDSRRRIEVAASATANITLSDVTIIVGGNEYANQNALALRGGSNVTLTITGTNSLTGGYRGAGIYVPANTTLTIDGTGSLSAIGTYYSGRGTAGIGGGYQEQVGNITINGGTINASSTNGTGIGGSGSTVTINGGSVNATSGGVSPQPQNGAGNNVYLNTLTVGGASQANAAVTAASINGVNCAVTPNANTGVYGIKGVTTDGAGKVYFYLPVSGNSGADAEEVTITPAGGATYKSTYQRPASATSQQLRQPVTYSAARANGADGTASTTSITLTFSKPVTGLTASNISFTDGTGAASKGSASVSSSDGGTTWTLSPITVTAQGTITVEVSNFGEYAITNASAETITIYKDTRTPEATPAAAIDYVNERLTGLVDGGTYSFNNGGDVTLNSTTEYPIDASWLNTTLSIVKKGNGATTVNSAAQSLPVPARPAAPGVGKTDCSVQGTSDGTLTTTTALMEYNTTSATHTGTWTACADANTANLAAGTYYVRVKAASGTGGNFTGVATSGIVIAAGAANAEVSPDTKTFTAATYGYGTQTAQEFTITNNGSLDITGVSADLGRNDRFAIDPALSGTTIAPGGSVTVSVYPKTGLAANAAAYTDALTVTGSHSLNLSVTLSFTVNKTTPTTSNLTYTIPDNHSYTGSARGIGSVTPNAGVGSVTVYYTGTGGTTYAKNTTAPTDAGTYSVTADVAEGSSYAAASGIDLGTYTIGKATAPSIIFPTSATPVTYGQALSASSLSGGDTQYGTFDWTNPATLPTVTNSGYSVTFTPNEATVRNYQTISPTADIVSLTVNAKDLSAADVQIAGTYIYNSTPQTPAAGNVTVTLAGFGSPLTDGTDYTYLVTSGGTDVGQATVTVTGQGNFTGTATGTFEISQNISNGTGIIISGDTANMPATGQFVFTFPEKMDTATVRTVTLRNSWDGTTAELTGYFLNDSVTFVVDYRRLDFRTDYTLALSGFYNKTNLFIYEQTFAFVTQDFPSPPAIARYITLPALSGVVMQPAAGSHRIQSGSDFTFTLTPPAGMVPHVTTDRNLGGASETLKGTQNADGSYTFVIRDVRENITVSITFATGNEAVGAASLKVWPNPVPRGGTARLEYGAPDNTEVRIYTMQGTLVSVQKLRNGQAMLTFPQVAGVYVVRVGSATVKAIVK